MHSPCAVMSGSRSRPIERRPGFTLIEAVVVLGIVLILAGLGLPAIQAARQAARQTVCRSRVRELLQATQHHVEAHAGELPYIANNRPHPDLENVVESQALSVHTQLLPFLGQSVVFDQINVRFPPRGLGLLGEVPNTAPMNVNTTAAAVSIETFLCPEDASRRLGPWGEVNYRASTGVTGFRQFSALAGPVPTAGAGVGTGVFRPSTVVRYVDVSDGASKTAAFSEKLRSRNLPRFDPMTDYWLVDVAYRDPNEMLVACSLPLPPDATIFQRTGACWMLPGVAATPPTPTTTCRIRSSPIASAASAFLPWATAGPWPHAADTPAP